MRLADQEAAVAALRERLRPGEVVLVKGSRYLTWEVAGWLWESTTVPAGDEVAAR